MDIQDIASQAIGLIAAPAPDSSWWDVCAGSAGKSLQLAELAGGRIRILATDIRESILNEAERRLQKGGWADCIRLQRLDAAQDPLPTEQFDGVLVDAPCSGTGTWSRNPDARWRWKPETLTELTALQATLLDRAAGCVKPGGTLLYATCSLTTAENTELITRFLQTHSEYTLSPFTNPLTGAPCPGQTYFWPWDGPGSGLFAARLLRQLP
jgi:16S rRNA (cytosine967-C5)-methyltransferase